MRSIRRIRGWTTSVRGPVASTDDLDEPILAELFSIERLEQHGASLAAAQSTSEDPRRAYALRSRVTENGRVLLASYRALARAIKDERAISPAAEWLVDNFHIVDEQLREIRDDLPADYYRELPKLAEGHLQGYPRVVGLAWAYVAHTDSRFDAESLHRFVDAYQRVEPLTIGELWAIAISLRIVLVENLRRLAESIIRGRDSRQKADELADGLLGLRTDRPELTTSSLRRLAETALSTPGQVQLFQRLRDQDPAVTPALGWLEEARCGARHQRRGDRPPRAPASGSHERDRPQRHHQHAPHLLVRLGRVRGGPQPRGQGPPRRQLVREHGLRHARPVPARHREPCPVLGPDRDGSGPPGDAVGCCARRGRCSRRWGRPGGRRWHASRSRYARGDAGGVICSSERDYPGRGRKRLDPDWPTP